GVVVHVRSTFTWAEGTWIGEEDERMLEKAMISGVTHTTDETLYRVDGIAPAPLLEALAAASVNVDTILFVGEDVVFSAPTEDATAEALAAGDVDVFLFSVGTSKSRELVPHAVRGGAVRLDKSAAFRLEDGIPLVVPEVNGHRALDHRGIIAVPNCCAIPLTT